MSNHLNYPSVTSSTSIVVGQGFRKISTDGRQQRQQQQQNFSQGESSYEANSSKNSALDAENKAKYKGSLYEVLGVPFNATQEVITRSYRIVCFLVSKFFLLFPPLFF